jgi:hypothetical protein
MAQQFNLVLFKHAVALTPPSPAKKSNSKIQKMTLREREKFLTRVE